VGSGGTHFGIACASEFDTGGTNGAAMVMISENKMKGSLIS
jgi:hypothetical protein